MQDDIEERYSTAILDANGNLMDVFLNDEEQWHLKIEDEVQDNLKNAVITYEDKNFYRHHGVDFLAIARAFRNNLNGVRRSGASTITMQVAKLAYPKKRTYINKYIEIVQAFKIENKLDKETILKLYLNNAPYGGNIVGYGTAARMYFQKDPQNLSWSECSLLAVLPNSPGSMSVEKNRDGLIVKRNYLLDKLHDKQKLTDEQLELAKKLISIKEELKTSGEILVQSVVNLLKGIDSSETENEDDEEKIQRTISALIEKDAGIKAIVSSLLSKKQYEKLNKKFLSPTSSEHTEVENYLLSKGFSFIKLCMNYLHEFPEENNALAYKNMYENYATYILSKLLENADSNGTITFVCVFKPILEKSRNKNLLSQDFMNKFSEIEKEMIKKLGEEENIFSKQEEAKPKKSFFGFRK